jgi:hypothetical protein
VYARSLRRGACGAGGLLDVAERREGRAMTAKRRMNPRKRPVNPRERWHPLAKLGVNYRSFGLNEGLFWRKPLIRKELTKTRIQGEFIPNPDKDLRRKTTGGRRACFRNIAQENDLWRLRELDSQKCGQTKYNKKRPDPRGVRGGLGRDGRRAIRTASGSRCDTGAGRSARW